MRVFPRTREQKKKQSGKKNTETYFLVREYIEHVVAVRYVTYWRQTLCVWWISTQTKSLYVAMVIAHDIES